MDESTLLGWLRGRHPAPPSPLLRLLQDGLDTERPVGGAALAARGEAALLRALETPGRDRRAAFHLLAGDALFTYACEALARDPDPGAGLAALLEELGGRLV